MGTATIINATDKDGNPSGGGVRGIGIDIEWQNGPLGRGKKRKEPNGTFVETVISVIIKRLEYFQKSKFAYTENAVAITHLCLALEHLDNRTKMREKRKVEETHRV